MTNKLIKSLALGAFAIGGGITTLASTSCGADFTPKGDFIISYSGNPYLGELTKDVKSENALVSTGTISIPAAPEGYKENFTSICTGGFDCENLTWEVDAQSHLKLYYGEEEDDEVSFAYSASQTDPTVVVIIQAAYEKQESGNNDSIIYSNQLAFYVVFHSSEEE